MENFNNNLFSSPYQCIGNAGFQPTQYMQQNALMQAPQFIQVPTNNYSGPSLNAVNQLQPQPMQFQFQPTQMEMANSQYHHTTPISPTNNETIDLDSGPSSDSEEETAPKTNTWQEVPSRKRKRSKNTHSITSQQIATSNKFSVLEKDNESRAKDTKKEEETISKPPPIFVYGVIDYNKMITVLTDIVEIEQYTTKTMANNVVKINAKTPEIYRKLIDYMKDAKIYNHTYQLKENKAYRIVIRNLHHTVPIEEIKKEVQKEGFKVRTITNIRHRITKEPLPMFYVDLEPATNNKEIYNLRYLNNQVIKVEPPHKNYSIVQCSRCQRYNHTKTYCNLPFACVKCGGAHDTKICKKTRDLPAKCALCKGDHPANYRGCNVYKELQQKIRPGTSNPRSIPQRSTTMPQMNANISQPTQQYSNKTYSQVVRQEQNNNSTENVTLSKFLDEFKVMFNQLMQQNNMVINMLSTVINKLCK